MSGGTPDLPQTARARLKLGIYLPANGREWARIKADGGCCLLFSSFAGIRPIRGPVSLNGAARLRLGASRRSAPTMALSIGSVFFFWLPFIRVDLLHSRLNYDAAVAPEVWAPTERRPPVCLFLIRGDLRHSRAKFPGSAPLCVPAPLREVSLCSSWLCEKMFR